jgi:hypothetical protein
MRKEKKGRWKEEKNRRREEERDWERGLKRKRRV